MIEVLVVALAAVVLVFALLSPLESLRWWRRRRDAPVLDALARPVTAGGDPLPQQPRAFAVYLSGIGSVDGSSDSRRERATLDAVAAALPDVVLTADVFPYAVENRALTQRATTWFWRRLQRLQRIPVARAPSYLINLRNALRVLVSADPRYGPGFNLAVAQAVVASLSRHGYDWRVRRPVTVIGYSGGGQIALGASWFLAALEVPVTVVSIGGVLSDDPALDRVQHVWHLVGTRDRVRVLGPLLFPGRWPTAPGSPWHRAVRSHRIGVRVLGAMRHMGRGDYFDRHTTTADGRTFRQATVDALVDVLGPPAPRGQRDGP